MKKIILLLASYFLVLNASFSQEIEWQNTIGGNQMDLIRTVKPTSDGGCIVAGDSPSGISGDKTENCIGQYDYWIIKLDAAGNIQWQNTIGGNYADDLFYAEQTIDGGYILGGVSNSNISGDKTENCMGQDDYWVIKLDSVGAIQWQNTIGGSSSDKLFTVCQSTDGGYICGGYSWSGISGDKTENNIGACDYWIVKLDPGGNIQWQNSIGGTNEDYLYSLSPTADGGSVCCGRSRSGISGDKTESCYGIDDYWVVKLDSTGAIQWQNTIGGIDPDIPKSVIQTSDGGYICAGLSGSGISGDKTENCLGASDCWIVKLDTAGFIQWQNTIGGGDFDWANSILQTSDGGYIFTGVSNSSISGDKTERCVGDDDCWVLKLDSAGAIQWQNTIGTTDQDGVYSISAAADGGFFIGVNTQGGISGDKSENSLGDYDYWVLKLTGKFNSITGTLFIDGNSNGVQDAVEFSLDNKRIAESNTGRFNFSDLNGTYLVSVLDTGNFTVVPQSINYYTPVPANHNGNFSTIQQTDSLNDFAFQPSGIFNDLCVTITPMGNFRGGFDASYMINYENVGTTTLTPTVIFFPYNNVTYVSSAPAATSVTTDSVLWNFGPLSPYETGNILVTVHVNSGTPIGALINSSVEIDPVAGDANTACNYAAYEVFVTGAVDPNAIFVDRDTVYATELSSPPYLNYIIYFQNTGNDTAFNVSVLNNIPQRLDISSFEFVSSSHPVNIKYSASSRLMEFDFENILLPDSMVNEPASHGFIRYRIKPMTNLIAGNKIFNRAAIYFDFNQPVLTNYALTEIVLATGINEFNVQNSIFNLFPNPANGHVSIDFFLDKNADVKIEVFNSFGQNIKTVLNEKLNSGKQQITFDASALPSAIYFVKMMVDGEMTVTKMIR